ncbi:MAG: methyltransferase domain-containing protein [Pseudomonadota bacterium]
MTPIAERLKVRALSGALALVAACALGACGGGGAASDDAAATAENPLDDPANLDVWLQRLEVGSREIFAARDAVADAVALQDGERVADIGAGTGLYSFLFADAVGDAGVVFAVDIEPRFLTLINQRASDLEIVNVTPVLGRADSVTLPPHSVDVVFISDTYNYFYRPDALMETVRTALAPGGRLFILDFDIEEGAARSAENAHVRVGKDALAEEVASFGFEFVGPVAVDGLAETYMLAFRKPA